MHKYLYLTHAEWASAWVNGGVVPLSLASKYKSMEREGIYTPDENLIHESNVDLMSLKGAVSFGENPNVRNFNFIGCRLGGIQVPDVIGASLYMEDGLIQSFCNVFDVGIANRLGKTACVRIRNIEKLRKYMDKRLGRRSRFGDCEYTRDHRRNHFLKSIDDDWQQEYRFFWPKKDSCSVELPVGVAEVVWTS